MSRPLPETPLLERLAQVEAAARDVLEANWLGRSTLPSRSLYPHQWCWDSAFIAMGRSWYDQERAQRELTTLFEAQWDDGRVPHIVFDPSVPEGAYFPGPGFWQSSRRSEAAPRTVETSGITQPPIHAAIVLEMHRHARDADSSRAFIASMYPRLVRQHAYLEQRRDPSGIGLSSIRHPWESGLDNSPEWDDDLAQLEIPAGAVPSYERHDLEHADPSDRPSDEAYDRFVYLAAVYREGGYVDGADVEAIPFLAAGPLFNGIQLWSTHALAELAAILGHDPAPHREGAARLRAAMLELLWDADLGTFLQLDVLSGRRGRDDTIAGFGPLLDPELPEAVLRPLVETLRSERFTPPRGRGYIVPSYDLKARDFDRRRYWRGPIWFNTNWLVAQGLRQHGLEDDAEMIALSSAELVRRSGFHEYFDPIDGRGYGSDGFGWTAALVIDGIERHRRRAEA